MGGCYFRCSTWNAPFQRAESSQKDPLIIRCLLIPNTLIFQGTSKFDNKQCPSSPLWPSANTGPWVSGSLTVSKINTIVHSPICCLNLSKRCCLVTYTYISWTLWLTSKHLSENSSNWRLQDTATYFLLSLVPNFNISACLRASLHQQMWPPAAFLNS